MSDSVWRRCIAYQKYGLLNFTPLRNKESPQKASFALEK